MPLLPQPGYVPTVFADSIEVFIGIGATGRAVASSTTLDMVAFVKLPGQSVASTFTPADVGMPIAIIGGGPIDPLVPNYFVRGAMFHTTIAAYVSPSHVTLTDAPDTSIFNTGFVTIICYRPVDFQMDSFTFQESIAPGTRNTAGFTVLYDSDYIERFEVIVKGQPVYIKSTDSNANLEFGGAINKLDVANQPGTDLGAQPIFSWTASCVDWASIAFRRVVNPVNGQVYSGNGDDVFKKLVFTNLIDEGVSCDVETAGPVELGAPSGAYINTLLDQLVQSISTPTQQWYWDTDPWRVFILRKRETVAAPWDIDDGYDLFAGSQPIQIVNSTSGDQLANFVFGIGQNVETGLLIVTLVGDGTAHSFNLPQPVQSVPSAVLNGGSQTVGVFGVDVGFDWYYNQGSNTFTQDISGTVLTSADQLTVTYQSYQAGIAEAPNVGSLQERSNVECTSGQYDYSFTIAQPIAPTDLLNLCIAYEQTYGVQPKVVQISTLRPGLAVGQLQHIVYAPAGIDGYFQIATVKVSTTLQVIQYDYTAFLGANTGGGITGLVQFVNRGTNSLQLLTPINPIKGSYSQITVNHTKVAGVADLTDFPLCFSGTYAFLADVANGGKVANSDGADIFFSLNSDGSSPLDFDLDFYSPGSGKIVAWVRLPTLSVSVDTILYINYGDASITVSTANPAGVWSPNIEHLSVPNNNFRAVYHFEEASSPFIDQTQYARNATSIATAPVRINGLFGFAQACTGAQSINVPQPLSGNGFGNAHASVTVWFMSPTPPSPADQVILQDAGGVGDKGITIAINTLGFAKGGSTDSGFLTSMVNVCDGNWHHLALTTDPSTNTKFYVDGVLTGSGAGFTTAFGGTYDANIADGNVILGYDPLVGAVDETHWTQVTLSAGWVATEYANQSSPATFYQFGMTPSVTTHVAGNPQGTVTHNTGALTNNLPVLGNGGADVKVGVAGQLVPAGGTTGQVLTKISATDYDDGWADATRSTHAEPLTDGNSNFIFAAGDIVVVVGVPD